MGAIAFPALARCAASAAILCAAGACAAGPELVNHSFQFDATRDSPGVTVLDYRYGNSKIPGARSPEDYIRAGRPAQSANIHGEMLRGDLLWVKWKVNSDDRIYEDTVDLKSRLPKNIEDDVIYFKIDGAQLYVYLVLPDRLTGGETSNGPAKYRYRKSITLYPDSARK